MPHNSLNPQQTIAVNYGAGPLLIIAGAGTGKTTVITERILNLITEKKISPQNILALTFTEKAAAEMEERIDVALPYGFLQVSVATFHSFCDRILRNDAMHIGLDNGYKLLTETESILFLKKHLFSLDLDYFRPLGNPAKFIQALLQHFSRLKDEDISPEQYLQYAQKISNFQFPISNENNREVQEEEIKKINELAKAYQTYETLKVKEGVMDFSDLISNTLLLFRTRKNVLQNYQKQFKYILIDEFQDTNFAQNELAILLAADDEKNITVVADDDQSIYRFRGSSISNVMQFTKQFPNTKIVTLTKNYRSTQTILDSAYALIQYNNPDRLEVKEHIDKKLISQRNITGSSLEFFWESNGENEAEKVAQTIQQLVKKSRKYSYKDCSILVRANDNAQLFVRTFERLKIPYQFLGPGKLFHQEEIKDLIAYLKVLCNFDDTPSLYRVLCIPIFKLSGTDIATILNSAKRQNQSLFYVLEHMENLSLMEQTKQTIQKIVSLIKKHLDLVSKESAGQLLYYFLEESELLKSMLTASSSEDERKAQNIAKFFEKLKAFETQNLDNSIFAVVDWIELSLQMGESPLASSVDIGQEDSVNILTLHSSKGLEFPVVFLVNLVKDRFPTRERREVIPIPQELIKEVLPEGEFHIQEERRLFYVGLTRARDMLFLTGAKYYGDGKRERKISPFVLETLGENTTKKIEEKEKVKGTQLSLLEIFPKETSKAEETKLTQSIPITYLSYSQVQLFEMCPLHYKLKYLLKVPTPPASNQSYGISIHAALRDFYQQQMMKKTDTILDIETILKKVWIPQGYESRQHEQLAFQKAVSAIKSYLENSFDAKKLPIALEKPFDFFLDKRLKIGGRIDRIDQIQDGVFEIIDYKTGSNIPTEQELKKNLQLTTYALAASINSYNLFGKKPKEILVSLYYIEENKKLTATRTNEELEEAKQLYLDKAKEISQSQFLCSGSIFCKSCEYRMLCNVR